MRAELGAHGALTGIDQPHVGPASAGSSTSTSIRSLHAPDMGSYFVRTTAISVENTHNFAGGTVVPWRTCRACARSPTTSAAPCTSTAPASGTPTSRPAPPLAAYGAIADTMAVCFSKGLGAPIGSRCSAPRPQIEEARVLRKRMGGGMRQVGVLAAAATCALDHHVERLAEDHEHARLLAEACGEDPDLTETNIVVVDGARRPGRRRRRPRARASWSAPSAPPACACSPTST